MTAYVEFIAVTGDNVLSEATGVSINIWWWGLLQLGIFAPLCMVRKMQIFNKTHLFADIAIVVMIIAVVVYGFIKLGKEGAPSAKEF